MQPGWNYLDEGTGEVPPYNTPYRFMVFGTTLAG